MTKNRLLNIAILICKLSKLIYIFSFILITIIFIHFQVDREYYNKFNTQINTESTAIPSSFSYNSKTLNKWGSNLSKDNNEVFTLDKISTYSIYINFFKYGAILILLYLCSKEFQKIIKSIKNLNTFKGYNVVSYFKESEISELNLTFGPLLLILIAFIMAEIFKEGNILMKGNELTV